MRSQWKIIHKSIILTYEPDAYLEILLLRYFGLVKLNIEIKKYYLEKFINHYVIKK